MWGSSKTWIIPDDKATLGDIPATAVLEGLAPGTAQITLSCKPMANGDVVHSDELLVTITKVELERNAAFSGDNDLPQSAPIQAIYGGVPVIGGPQEATSGGIVFMSYVVELEATIIPAGPNLDLADFSATQTYHITITKTFDNAPPDIAQADIDDGTYGANDTDRDGEGGGDTYFLIDGPGPGKQAVEQLLTNDPHMTAIETNYEFTTVPTWTGNECGNDFNWTVTVKATKQADGTIVWTGS